MSVAKPKHLLLFDAASGTTVANTGTVTTAWTVGGSGTDPTDYTWVTNADSDLSYFESKQEDTAVNPGISTAATAPSGVLEVINFAAKFRVTATPGVGTHFLLYNQFGLGVYVTNTAGTFTLSIEVRDVFSQGNIYTITALAYGTDYRLAVSIDPTTNTATQVRYKLDANATVSPAPFNLDSSFGTAWPFLLRGSVATGEGLKSRVYWAAIDRGAGNPAWSSTDLGDINTSPTAITGWPSSGSGVPKTSRLTMLGVG